MLASFAMCPRGAKASKSGKRNDINVFLSFWVLLLAFGYGNAHRAWEMHVPRIYSEGARRRGYNSSWEVLDTDTTYSYLNRVHKGRNSFMRTRSPMLGPEYQNVERSNLPMSFSAQPMESHNLNSTVWNNSATSSRTMPYEVTIWSRS